MEKIEVGDTVKMIVTGQIGIAGKTENLKDHFRVYVSGHSAGVVPVDELKLISKKT